MEDLTFIFTSGRILGNLFYYPPNIENQKPIWEALQHLNWQKEWCPLPQNWQHQWQDVLATLCLDKLAEEYQMLFIGPNSLSAPPWGSTYLDREAVMFGDSLLRLRTFLREHHIVFQSSYQEAEDHIGLVLCLSSYLCEVIPTQLPTFLSEHVLSWAYRYLELLSLQKDSSFYALLAKLTNHTLQYWQQQLQIQPSSYKLYR